MVKQADQKDAEKKKKKKKKSKADKATAEEKKEGPAMATQIWNDEQQPL